MHLALFYNRMGTSRSASGSWNADFCGVVTRATNHGDPALKMQQTVPVVCLELAVKAWRDRFRIIRAQSEIGVGVRRAHDGRPRVRIEAIKVLAGYRGADAKLARLSEK